MDAKMLSGGRHAGRRARRKHRRRPLVRAAVLAVLACPGTLWATSAGAVAAAARPPAVSVAGRPAPAGLVTVTGVSCAGSTDCWAVGSGLPAAGDPPGSAPGVVVASTDGGLTWSAQPVGPRVLSLSAVSCPDTRSCMAVGDASVTGGGGAGLAGAVVVTTDGGRHWRLLASLSGAVDVTGVDCPSAGHCVVLATDGTSFWSAATADDGAVWQRGGDLAGGMVGPGDPSCTTTADCVVAGYVPTSAGQGAGAIAVTADGGATWTAATVPSGLGLLHAVSCVSGGHCLAVGTSSSVDTDVQPGNPVFLVSEDGGATWTANPAPAAVADPFGVACPGGSRCVVAGTQWISSPPSPTGAVVATTDGGARWVAAARRYVPGGLVSVACPGVSWCVAGGGDVLARVTLPEAAVDKAVPGAPHRFLRAQVRRDSEYR